MRLKTGFTLYELLIALSIVSIVLATGIPNLRAYQQNSRMISAANNLHSSFYQARGEAARSKTNITICASADPTLDTPICGGGFKSGWVLFEDRNADLVVDAGEPVLRRYPPMHDTITITTPEDDDYFMVSATGLGRQDIAGSTPVSVMVLCDSRGNVTAAGGRSAARVVVVLPVGRAVVLSDKAQVAARGGCPADEVDEVAELGVPQVRR